MRKNVRNWRPTSQTDWKIEQPWKEKLLSSNSWTNFLFRVVQFFQSVWLVGCQLRTRCEITCEEISTKTCFVIPYSMWAIWYEPAMKTPRSFAFRNLTIGRVMVRLGWKRRKMVLHNPRSCASATSNAMATCSGLQAHPWGPQGHRRRWGKSGRNQGDGNACFATIMYVHSRIE